ncbi:MAG: ribosomal L7Ae/L30e/S12e/Gadd45 family protein [Candidatus Woesearchaeota archaeon]
MANEEQALEIVELARKTGKIKKGTNEATKALERSTALLVVYASDASPKEIIMHLPILAKEKGIACVEVPTKAELGAAAGLEVATAAIAVLDAGEAKDMIAKLEE